MEKSFPHKQHMNIGSLTVSKPNIMTYTYYIETKNSSRSMSAFLPIYSHWQTVYPTMHGKIIQWHSQHFMGLGAVSCKSLCRTM